MTVYVSEPDQYLYLNIRLSSSKETKGMRLTMQCIWWNALVL